MRNVGILAVLVIVALAAGGENLRPRLILSSETRDSGLATDSNLRKYIEIFFSRSITESMTLELNLRARHDELSTELSGLNAPSVADSLAWELRPAGLLLANFGPVSTETTWAMRNSSYKAGEDSSSRENEQVSARAAWGARRQLPGGLFSVWRSQIDDSNGREALNELYSGALDYNWRGFGIGVGEAYQIDRDTTARYERTTVDDNAVLSYNGTYANGKFSVAATAYGAATKISDRATGPGARIPTIIPPSRAFWGIDDTPIDSSDHPLSAFPALIDGRASVLTTIDLGPSGPSFQAIAFDIGRVSKVDEIQIVVRDEKVDPVTLPEGITWDIYTSDDGVRWTLHGDGLAVSFDAVRSQYEIAFRQVEVRWIKVVNFGVAAQPAFVTEAFVLFHTAKSNGVSDVDMKTFSTAGTLTYTPVRSVTVGYMGTGYKTEQVSGDTVQWDVDDLSQIFTVRYDPGRSLGYEARYELHDITTSETDQRIRDLSASVRYSPRPQLSSTLTCLRREELLELMTFEGSSCSLSIMARVFPTLDITASASEREQQLQRGGTEFSRSFQTAWTARLTNSLRTTLSIAANRSRNELSAGFTTPTRQDDRAAADIAWSSGRAFEVGATLGWIESTSFSGLTQRYRIRWSPFGNGSVSLTTNYLQDIDPYSNSQSRRLLFAPRWQVNPWTALEVTYTSVTRTGESQFDSDALVAALIIGR